jgi:hypothetical protein
MNTPQAGIFALEFDILDAKKRNEFASTISAIRENPTLLDAPAAALLPEGVL